MRALGHLFLRVVGSAFERSRCRDRQRCNAPCKTIFLFLFFVRFLLPKSPKHVFRLSPPPQPTVSTYAVATTLAATVAVELQNLQLRRTKLRLRRRRRRRVNAAAHAQFSPSHRLRRRRWRWRLRARARSRLASPRGDGHRRRRVVAPATGRVPPPSHLEGRHCFVLAEGASATESTIASPRCYGSRSSIVAVAIAIALLKCSIASIAGGANGLPRHRGLRSRFLMPPASQPRSAAFQTRTAATSC